MQETFNLASSSNPKSSRFSQVLAQCDIYLVGALVLALLGLGLRLYQLDAKSLRLDESYNYGTATGVSSWDLLLGRVYRSGHPPFYYLGLHQWIKYLGNSEFILRLPSVMAGTVEILGLYLAGRSLFNPQVGLIAAGFVVINPFLVSYSQEAGVYSFFAMTSVFMLLFFWRALQSPRLANWLLFSAAAVATLYVHLFTLYLFVAEPLIVLPLVWRRGTSQGQPGSWIGNRLLRGWLVSLSIRALATLLVMPTLSNAAHQPAENPLPSVTLAQMFYRLLKAYTYRLPFLNDNHTFLEMLPVVVSLLLVVVGASPAWSLVRSWFSAQPPNQLIEKQQVGLATYVLAWWLVMPPLIVFGLSFYVHMFAEPYLISGTNFFWLLVANGLLLIWQRLGKLGQVGAVALSITLVAAAIWWLGIIFFDPRADREPWRQAMAYLGDKVAQGDVLLLEPDYDYKVVAYYYQGYEPLPTFLMSAPYSAVQAQMLIKQAQHDQPAHYWLVLRRDDNEIGTNGLLRQQFDKTMHLVSNWHQNVLEIREYVTK